MALTGVSIESLRNLQQNYIPKVRRGMQESQKLSVYAGTMLLIMSGRAVTTNDNYEYGWNVRLRSADGSTHEHQPYARHNATQHDVQERASVKMATRVNTALKFETLIKAYNGGSAEKVNDQYKMDLSAQQEEINNALESEACWGVPPSSTLTNKFLGIPYWFGRFCDSSGNFSASETPGYNGIRTRFGNGTASSTIGGIDASPVANDRWRALGFTHAGVVDDLFIAKIKVCIEEQKFQRLPGLTGEGLEGAKQRIFVCPTIYDHASDYCAKQGPDDGEMYMKAGTTPKIFGVPFVRTPGLAGDASLPIYGINSDVVEFLKVAELWMKDGDPRPIGTTSYMVPHTYAGQFIAKMRRTMGFFAHGEY